uniref:Sphingosine-1-phosphate phosphatase 1 n=1 Tax=Neogobius melanostomus TaxID=47308 RepID=A0A8C6S760_9GOBI
MEQQSRLRGLFDYLQDPYLVARFQHVCGIRGTFSPAEECGTSTSGNSGECDRKRALNNGTSLHHKSGESEAGKAGVFEAGEGERHTSDSQGLHKRFTTTNVSVNQGEDGEKLTQNGAASLGKPRRKNSLTGDAGQEFIIGNRFLFYLFTFGTELGNELFYLIFFPFVMWNVDALVGRRIIMVWAWVMYLGQCTKDLLGWSRPASPPVVKVEMFYNSEYSMPSTHAMSGTAIPFALFYMTHGRWEYPFAVGFSVALSWCVLVCVSRIYMGMHSVLDVLAGVLYSSLILLISLPALDLTDLVVLHSSWAPLVVLGLPLFLAMLCFRLDAWSTSRGDTAQILGSGRDPLSASLALPNITAWLLLAVLLRMLIGVAVLVLTRAVMKALTLSSLCRVFPSTAGGDVRQARQNMHIELPYRYIVYSTVGFNVLFLVPLLFSYVQL